MITALRQKVTVRRGGWISLRSKTLKAGDTAEVIVLVEPQEEDKATAFSGQALTANGLLRSGLVGLWSKKKIGDSLEFAQTLRSVAEKRGDYK
jgi:hypothetical protein